MREQWRKGRVLRFPIAAFKKWSGAAISNRSFPQQHNLDFPCTLWKEETRQPEEFEHAVLNAAGI